MTVLLVSNFDGSLDAITPSGATAWTVDDGDEGAICAFAVRWGNNVVAHQFYLAEDRGPVRFQSWPLLAPSGVTTIYVRATLALAPATLAFSELTIYDLTALGLA